MPINVQELVEDEILENYQLVRKLGSGAYGHVWKVKQKNNQNFYALKKIFSAFQNDLDAQRTFRQISLLSKLQHPNIAKLIKVIKAKNNMDIYLVFSYMESDLYKAIKGDYLNEVHKKYIIYQLANTLKYLHSGGILHRDLKPSNILINSDCKIQLCDFGLSRTTYSYNGVKPVITEFIATRWYRAPQVLLGSKQYTNKSDMWSLGCLIYQLYAKRPLLPGNDSMDQIQKLLQFKGIPSNQQKQSMNVKQIDKILSHFSVEKKLIGDYFSVLPNVQIKRLLLKSLQYDPNQRLSAEQLLQSSYLSQFRNFQKQPIMHSMIKLQQNQSQKLNVDKYRQLIYTFFINSQKKPITINFQVQQKQKQKTIAKQKLSHKKYNSLHNDVVERQQIQSNKQKFRQPQMQKQKETDNMDNYKKIVNQIQKEKQSIKFNIKKRTYHSSHKSNVQSMHQNTLIHNKLPVFDHINISLNKQPKRSFLQTIKATPIILNKNRQSKLFKTHKKQHSFQSFIKKARNDIINQSEETLQKKYIICRQKIVNKTTPNSPKNQEKIKHHHNLTLQKGIKQNLIVQERQKLDLNPIKKKKTTQLVGDFVNFKKRLL